MTKRQQLITEEIEGKWWLTSFSDGSERGCVGPAEQAALFANRHNLGPGEILVFPPLRNSKLEIVECLYFANKKLRSECA